jgi:hypothetical protein|tara:strand:- start:15 stop:392 length:378 start_codon:yes stop_codon:yes gene_type:complete
VIKTFFEAGKTKNFSSLGDIQLNSEEFSSFSDIPPYGLKNYSESIALEELRFASISDYDYEIKNDKTSIFGNVGITTFVLNQKGMLVDSQTYTGQHITINGRATFVLVKEDTWKIMHYHLDKISN